MFRIIATWLAALACFATAAIVPSVYVMGLDHVTFGALVVNFVTLAPFAYIGYVVFNVMSGLSGQGEDTTLYWLDYVSSWIAWFCINLTAVFVVIGIVQAYSDVTDVLKMQWAIWILGGLVLFSWIDVGLLQRHKHANAQAWANANRAVAPPAPLPPPPVTPVDPPANVQGSGVGPVGAFLAAVLIVLVLFAAFYNFGEGTGGKLGLNDSEKSVPVCSRFVGKNSDGVAMYTIHHDC